MVVPFIVSFADVHAHVIRLAGHRAAPRLVLVTKGPSGLGFNLGRVGDYPLVKGVDAGGACEAAGMRGGDVIIAVGVACGWGS